MSAGGIGLLLIGGEGPTRTVLETILAQKPRIIAADSGFDLARRLSVEPELLVGDLDSVADTPGFRSFPADRIRRFPPDKDETDTEIGLRLFRELGVERVVLAGGGGGSLEHLVGILALFEREERPAAWYTAREHVQAVARELILEGCRGQSLSLFPLGSGARGLSSEGLKWPLDGLNWSRGDAGVSNRCVADRVVIRVRAGRLLMVRTL
ncbi:MAG: thiamine diphosphokinase [Spirochaetales bacterium]|nr:thiamine diphosphokinase [Spirochaetales bacterium]